MKFALHLTDKPTGTHLGTVTDVLAWTVDDLGARFATVVTDDGETPDTVEWSLDATHPTVSTRRVDVQRALRAIADERNVHGDLGLLDEQSLVSLMAEMDEAAIVADEAVTDRIAERTIDHAQETT